MRRTASQERVAAVWRRNQAIEAMMPGTGYWVRDWVACLECGAAVPAANKSRHFDWHQRDAQVRSQARGEVAGLSRREVVGMHDTLVALFG